MLDMEFAPHGLMHGPEIDPLDRVYLLTSENQDLRHENQQLHQDAITDELTGLNNRRGLREWAETSYDPNRSYAILVIDFADFKSLNDAHSQEVGDEALRIFGEVFPSALRTHEHEHDERRAVQTNDATAVRLGGDEFVAIIDLDHLPPEQFNAILEIIKTRLKNSYRSACDERLPVSPRLRMDNVTNFKGETFEHFFRRGNTYISTTKAHQKAAEARARIEELGQIQDGISFS